VMYTVPFVEQFWPKIFAFHYSTIMLTVLLMMLILRHAILLELFANHSVYNRDLALSCFVFQLTTHSTIQYEVISTIRYDFPLAVSCFHPKQMDSLQKSF